MRERATRPILRAMDKRSAIILVTIGVMQLAPVAALKLVQQDAWWFVPLLGFMVLWLIASGAGLILWGVWSLRRTRRGVEEKRAT